MTKSGSST